MGIEGVSFNFSPEKNKKLLKERGTSFEEVIAAIEADLLLDVVVHPNQRKYPDQKMYVVYIDPHVFLVPFVRENEDTLFLKTIIPSRKARKHYSKMIEEMNHDSEKRDRT